jgi:glycosyltransferase involved in cell wall biosynthesis
LGGSGNEGVPNAIGFVDYEEQKRLLRSSRVYLYAAGLTLPYTLNFIEAWMTGIPVVALHPAGIHRNPGFPEFTRLIRDGDNGFIARTPRQANAILRRLLSDHDLARRIGNAGRRSAIDVFGTERAKIAWKSALETITTKPSGRIPTAWNRVQHLLRRPSLR